jgi:hypothetical protein
MKDETKQTNGKKTCIFEQEELIFFLQLGFCSLASWMNGNGKGKSSYCMFIAVHIVFILLCLVA